MTRSPILRVLLVAGLACAPHAAVAQAAPAAVGAGTALGGDTVRLSDEERDAILNGNTVGNTADGAAAARGGMVDPDRGAPRVHGEVGAFAGSHDSRGVFGTAAIPLGDRAGAVVSFGSEQFGRRR